MRIKNKIIGLIGGMGPYASAYFYKLLLKKSSGSYGARDNNDFPEILIDSVPVPDFISDTNKLKDAKNMLKFRILKMNHFGVKSIGMICNTGHILYKDLSKISKSKFYSMINLVAAEAANRKLLKVGVLATPTTIKANLYGDALAKMGIKTVYPENKSIKLHESIIRNVISGADGEVDLNNLVQSTKTFINQNKLDGIILGCTELPLVFPKEKFTNVIDCMDVLADKLLEKYYN